MARKGSASPMYRQATGKVLKAEMIDPCLKVTGLKFSSDYT